MHAHLFPESESESTDQSEYETTSSESTEAQSVEGSRGPPFDDRWMLRTDVKSNTYIPQVNDGTCSLDS